MIRQFTGGVILNSTPAVHLQLQHEKHTCTLYFHLWDGHVHSCSFVTPFSDANLAIYNLRVCNAL